MWLQQINFCKRIQTQNVNKKKNMLLTYCSACDKYTDNVSPKILIMMTNIKIKTISKCAGCLTNKLYVDKIKHKNELKVIVSFFN